MKAQVQTYQTNDLEGQLTFVDSSPKYTKASKIVFGLIVAALAVAAVVSAFTPRSEPALTDLQVAMGEKGMLKRGMVTDPSQLSPGLRDQLAGSPVGEHGLVKKGIETTALSPGLAAHLSGAAAGQHDVKASTVSAPAAYTPYKPPAYSAPAAPPAYTPPSFSAPPPPTISAPALQPPPAAPGLLQPSAPVAPKAPVAPLLAARPPVSSAAIGDKTYGEKAMVKRGAVEDPTLLSPGLRDQLAGAPVGEHGLIKKGDLDITQASPGLLAHTAGVAAGQHDAKMPGY